jgi:hypothetical protein
MNIETENLFHGMDMTPLGALGNIDDLLAASEVCLCSNSKKVNSIAFELIELARLYAKASRVQGGVA